jgi:hypothetical protein
MGTATSPSLIFPEQVAVGAHRVPDSGVIHQLRGVVGPATAQPVEKLLRATTLWRGLILGARKYRRAPTETP